MNPRMCEYEQSVLGALAKGRMRPDLQAHVSGCEACAETAAVFGYLKLTSAENVDSAAALPSAHSIFWRAQIAEKRELAERSVAAIKTVQRIAMILAAAIAVASMAIWLPGIVKAFALPGVAVAGLLVLVAMSAAGVFYLSRIESRLKGT